MRIHKMSRVRSCFVQLAFALPLLMLAMNVLAWLRWGTDLPFLDDWRAYDEKNALSLSPTRLFEAINNTITPVGLALDALAQRWLGGNPVPYQAISMVGVLGGLLWLQWRLLRWAVRDRVPTPLVWVCCVFMLQSGTYWGEQNLAYHQALPLLALLGATSLNFTSGRYGVWRGAGIAVLGAVSGLSYISGAIAAFAMGLTWLLMGWWCRSSCGSRLEWRAKTGGWILLATGAGTSALQIGLTRRADTRKQITELTWPSDPDFWYYMAGKIGRSSGHGFQSVTMELAWVALLMVAVGGAAVLVLAKLRGVNPSVRRPAFVFLPLLVVVGAYLVLVSLGRAGYRDASIEGFVRVFRFGYERFHFFWVTLLFPWVAAVWFLWWQRLMKPLFRSQGVMLVPFVVICIGLGVAAFRGVFDVSQAYRQASEYRAGEIRCLHRQLGSGGPIVCPGYPLMDIHDLTRGYLYALDIEASFVRYFPIVERETSSRWLMRWPEEPIAEVDWVDIKSAADDQRRLETGDDAQIHFRSADREAFSQCRMLEIQVGVRSELASSVQVFYSSVGANGVFSEDASASKRIPGNWDFVERRFLFESRDGFSPQVRIDPLTNRGRVRVEAVRVLCRLSREVGR